MPRMSLRSCGLLGSRLRGNERCVDSNEICSNITRTPALTSNSVASPMSLPLSGLLVVSLEQAVAAPMCTCRLADAGARVIKVERPEGDFARYYDKLAVPRARFALSRNSVHSPPPLAGEGQGGGTQQDSSVQARPLPNPPPRAGEGADRASGEEGPGKSAYFVWLNRGKESLVLDLAREDDKALLAAIIAKADVFVQNLKPGAVGKLGFAVDKSRQKHPLIVICEF